MAKSKARKRTIAKELLAAWQKQTCNGDIEKLSEILGLSKPTVFNAVSYGAVSRPEYVEKINQYFENRLTAEREAAAKLNELAK